MIKFDKFANFSSTELKMTFKQMSLFKLTNLMAQRDSYTACVVAAESAHHALRICPDGLSIWNDSKRKWMKEGTDIEFIGWPAIADIQFERIGDAVSGILPGVILASYFGD